MRTYPIILGLFLLGLLCSCEQISPDKNLQAVAEVNNRLITADEIRFAYELCPRKITQLGKQKALNFILEEIIDQTLLAKEAARLNLANQQIKRTVEYYKRAETNRQLYHKHIRDSVQIRDAELRQAYKRSLITLYVKHYQTNNHQEAKQISTGQITPGHQSISPVTETKSLPPYGKVDLITWNNIQWEWENLLHELPLYQRSKPIWNDGIYHIFQVLDQEKNMISTENNYMSRKSSLESAIRKRKEHHRGFEFVQRIMQPQHLVIKGEVLQGLTDFIWSENRPKRQEIQYIKIKEIAPQIKQKINLSNQIIADYSAGNLTVADFLFYYRLNPQVISFKSKKHIKSSLTNAIATYVRDIVFADIGIKEGLDECLTVKREAQQWREKLLANEMKKIIHQQSVQNCADSSEIWQIYQANLDHLIQKLRNNAEIHIDKEILMAIQTSDEGLPRKIDFFAKYLQ